MLLYPPYSRIGRCRSYEECLPTATYELCGDQGVMVAVGFATAAMVYRGTFNKEKGTGSWAFTYAREGDEDLVKPGFDIDYACKMALIRIQYFIEDYETYHARCNNG